MNNKSQDSPIVVTTVMQNISAFPKLQLLLAFGPISLKDWRESEIAMGWTDLR